MLKYWRIWYNIGLTGCYNITAKIDWNSFPLKCFLLSILATADSVKDQLQPKVLIDLLYFCVVVSSWAHSTTQYGLKYRQFFILMWKKKLSWNKINSILLTQVSLLTGSIGQIINFKKHFFPISKAMIFITKNGKWFGAQQIWWKMLFYFNKNTD